MWPSPLFRPLYNTISPILFYALCRLLRRSSDSSNRSAPLCFCVCCVCASVCVSVCCHRNTKRSFRAMLFFFESSRSASRPQNEIGMCQCSSFTAAAVLRSSSRVPEVAVDDVCAFGAQQQEIEPRQHFCAYCNNQTHIVGLINRYKKHTAAATAVAHTCHWNACAPPFGLARLRDTK